MKKLLTVILVGLLVWWPMPLRAGTNVTGTIIDALGNTVTGNCTLTPVTAFVNGSNRVVGSPAVVSFTSGVFTANIVPGTYIGVCKSVNGQWRENGTWTVPNTGSTVDISTVISLAPPGSASSPALTWRGVWDSSTAYVPNDLVSLTVTGQLSVYIAIQAGTNQNPATQTAYWQLFAGPSSSGALSIPCVSTGGSISGCTSIAVGDGSASGVMIFYEKSSNGNSYIAAGAPDSIPLTYRWNSPSDIPAGSGMYCPAPDGNSISQCTWVSYLQGTFSGSTTVAPSLVGTVPNGNALCGSTSNNFIDCGVPPGSYDPTVTTNMLVRDEFLCGSCGGVANSIISETGFFWQNIAGTGSSAGTASIANHPGLWSVTTGATSGNGVAITKTFSGVTPFDTLTAGSGFTSWTSTFIFRTDASTVATSSYLVGWGNAIGDPPGNFIGIAGSSNSTYVCASSESTANWNFVTRSSASGTCQDSTVGFAANTWYKVTISTTDLATFHFTLTDYTSSVVSSPDLTTNIPAGALTPIFNVATITTAARTITADFFAFKGSGMTR